MGNETVVSLSLLRPLENFPQCNESAFSLGVSELFGEPPSSKKLKLSLRSRGKARSACFQEPITAKEYVESAKGVVPTNMKNTTSWALRNFQEWSENSNRSVLNDLVPVNLFEVDDAKVVCRQLCCFVQKTRKESGGKYPASSLRQMLFNMYCARTRFPLISSTRRIFVSTSSGIPWIRFVWGSGSRVLAPRFLMPQ